MPAPPAHEPSAWSSERRVPVRRAPRPAGFESLLSAFKPLVPIPRSLLILPRALVVLPRAPGRSSTTTRRAGASSSRRGTHRLPARWSRSRCAPSSSRCRSTTAAAAYFDAGAAARSSRASTPRTRKAIRLAKYDELYGFALVGRSRASSGTSSSRSRSGRSCFREDSLLDMGLRTRGFFKHAWIYGLFLAIVLPTMLIVSRQPDFGSYYPFYKALLALLVRLPPLGGDVLRAVLRARDVLPRLLARRRSGGASGRGRSSRWPCRTA